MMDNLIHQINHYPLDSDLSDGLSIMHPFNNWGLVGKRHSESCVLPIVLTNVIVALKDVAYFCLPEKWLFVSKDSA